MTDRQNSSPAPIHIIGGGLAGSEAAWQIARAGVPVVLHEMRPQRATDVHKTGFCAELVCSNSFRSDDCETNAGAGPPGPWAKIIGNCPASTERSIRVRVRNGNG